MRALFRPRAAGLFAPFVLLAAGVAPACNEVAEDSSRIAIAGGSLTEIVYFLGAENRIIATDRTSNFPQAALAFPSVGYVRALSSEGLLSLSPTLVLGEHDMGPPEVFEHLSRVDVDVVRVPEAHTTDGIIDKIRCVGKVLGLDEIAESRIRAELDDVVAALNGISSTGNARAPRVGVLLGIRDGLPFAAGSDTSGDGLLHMAGADNVFAGFSGWKPASMESMVRLDPELLVIPARGVESAGGIERIADHPAIRLTTAGRNRSIVTMDGMAMLGFGPRTLAAAVDLARELGTLTAGSMAVDAAVQ